MTIITRFPVQGMPGCSGKLQARARHQTSTCRCNRAFLHNRYVGAAVFGGLILNYTFIPG